MGKLKSIRDCLRYPFLWPRNRFTGLHYNNWEILEWVRREKQESTIYVHLILRTDNISGPLRYDLGNGRYLTLEIHGPDEVWVVLGKSGGCLERVVSKLKFPGGKILEAVWGKEMRGAILTKVKKLPEKPKFISGRIIYSPFRWLRSKAVEWFHGGPLQIFHCIPDRTEIDALEKGWRLRFGDDLLRDLRRAIRRDCGILGLFRFRIIQIKEKYGYLHFYYSGGGEEVREVIGRYEDLSREVCINCGKDATWITTGWISPWCDDCVPKEEKKEEL